MPAQQHVRRDQPARPHMPGEQPGQGAIIARSARSSLGLGFCRRSTATFWSSTSSSASFHAAERASSTIQPDRRTNIR
jgi:hypothetical protein